MIKYIKSICWLTIFSIFMGFLETAVVIYLRKLYYPEVFKFPIVLTDDIIGLTELLRETATIIMLLAVGILTGNNVASRFAYFIFSFAIWDIFYYVFLKLLINWPSSFLTWDILFLLPLPWVGPVIAPCILSVTMIILAILILFFNDKKEVKIHGFEWLALTIGSSIIIVSFILGFIMHACSAAGSSGLKIFTGKVQLINQIESYTPVHFNWLLFIAGELILVFIIIRFVYRNKRRNEGWFIS
jgi:hypothetical protein